MHHLKDKSDDSKDSLHKEAQQAVDLFHNYHIKILLRFECKIRREDIFKLTTGSDSRHQNHTDNGVIVVHCAALQNLSRAQCSCIRTFIITLGLSLIGQLTITFMVSWQAAEGIQVYFMSNSSVQLSLIMITSWSLPELGRDCWSVNEEQRR
jgi:hypothetical protein